MRPELAVVVGGALATMAIFALSPTCRAVDELESSTRGKFVAGSFVRRGFYWFIRPVERASLALGLSPLFYNLLGVFFGAVAGWLFASGRFATAGWVVLVGLPAAAQAAGAAAAVGRDAATALRIVAAAATRPRPAATLAALLAAPLPAQPADEQYHQQNLGQADPQDKAPELGQ